MPIKDRKCLSITKKTYDALKERRHIGQSYDGVIQELLEAEGAR